MLGIFRTQKATLFPFGTDMHSHILPGIDDGAKDVDGSIRLIEGFHGLGYKKSIATPHIYAELYPNDPATIGSAHQKLAVAMEQRGCDFPVRYAAEYFLDDSFRNLVLNRHPLLTIHENWVLVETSFVQAPMDFDQRLFDLQVAGYKPVLAHPERYPYWHGNKNLYHGLRDRGVLFQVNLLSLAGYYGKPVAEAAKFLVTEKLVDLVGTDAHHERHLSALQRSASAIIKQLTPLIREDKIMNVAL
jgi:tyrosine-protein phosphatase YwqE